MENRVREPLIIASRQANAKQLSVTAPETSNWPEAMLAVLQKPMGARFYRCALQVNTPLQSHFKGFETRHARNSPAYKRDYGLALAKQCKKAGIDAVGICDHNSVDYLDAIRRQLNEENIFAFPGFEVASTEGLHVLCLFDLNTPAEELDHILTELDLPPKERWVAEAGGVPRQSPKSFPEIIDHVQRKRRGICIAAHMDRENGLLFECAKTTRAQYLTDGALLAGQISGSRQDLTKFHRKVLNGELNHYRRERPLALINCLDVYNLKDLGQPACSTWIKMSTPSLEGLRQAFLDAESRLRLLTEEESHQTRGASGAQAFKLVAMYWEGGFLDGCGIRFNENLNCLIGGRGAGKSTVIESLRFVLQQEPLGKTARKTYESLLEQVIKAGTKISLLLSTQNPAPGYYRIERVYLEKQSQPAAVFDENGERCMLQVFDLVPGIDILGQHEIAEIAAQPEKQLALLHRFRRGETARAQAQTEECQVQLAGNRQELMQLLPTLAAFEEQLNRLPGLEERLRDYRSRGIEEKLYEQGLLAREEQMLRSQQERLQGARKTFEQMRRFLEISGPEAGRDEQEKLLNHDLLEKMRAWEERWREQWQNILHKAEAAWQAAEREMLALRQEWETRKRDRQEEYQKILRELQKEGNDGVDYVNVRKEIERLAPLRLRFQQLKQKRLELEKQRRQLVRKREEAQKLLLKTDRAAAERVSQLLDKKVRVTVQPEAERKALCEMLKALKLGLREDFYKNLQALDPFCLAEFIDAIRAGEAALQKQYDFSAAQARALARIPQGKLFELEEMVLPHGVCIEMNVAPPEEKPLWRPLSDISIGQKATAILLMLLPESGTPLIIDQPEDDLDNRFITDTIIPKLREEKQRRQFLFATHNANIPVLGDAEQIIGLETGGDAGRTRIHPNSIGSIDCAPVKELVEQILEGGQKAFEMRRMKYGF